MKKLKLKRLISLLNTTELVADQARNLMQAV